MVAQKELDDRLKAVNAQLLVEEHDWKEEERKLFELEETYLRDTAVHGSVFTGWGEPKTAPVRFRNAALRRKKRERQDPALGGAGVDLSEAELLKLDTHRFASFSSVTSPAEPLLATLDAREKKLAAKLAAKSSSSGGGGGVGGSSSSGNSSSTSNHSAKPSKKAKK